jgi:hypothetical protein
MAYDILLRRQIRRNYARKSTIEIKDPFATPQAQEEIRSVKLLKLAADKGDPIAKQLWTRKLGFLRDMKKRSAGGYPDSAHCKRAMEVLAAEGIVVSGWPRKAAGRCLGASGIGEDDFAAAMTWWNGTVAAMTAKDSLLDNWEREQITKNQPLVKAALARNDKKEATRLINAFHSDYSYRRSHPSLW